MTKQEYERLTNTTVCQYDYYKIIEPMYMATNLSKQDFVRTINADAFNMPEPPEPDEFVRVRVPYRYNELTERYEWDLFIIAKYNGMDIGTGKAQIELLDESKHNEFMADVWNVPVVYEFDLKDCCANGGRTLGKAFYRKLNKITAEEFKF